MSDRNDDDTRALDAEELFQAQHEQHVRGEEDVDEQFMGVQAGAVVSRFGDEDEDPEQSPEGEEVEGTGREGDKFNEDLEFTQVVMTRDDGTGEPGPPVLNAAGQPAGHALPLDDETWEAELERARREGWLPEDADRE